MTRILQVFENSIVPYVNDLYSLHPNNKTAGIDLDHLVSHRGYIQYYIVKHNDKELVLEEKSRKSSVKIREEFLNEHLASVSSKENERKKIYNLIQSGIEEITSLMRNLVFENPNNYQAELSRKIGFDKYGDNNWIFSTLCSMMVSNSMLSKTKKSNRVYYEIGGNNKYPVVPYIYRQGITASMGEALIANYAISNNITFTQQYSFKECKYKKPLRFDFMFELKDEQVLIEFQGEQHYKFISKFHKNQEQFREQQIKDKIKKEFCLDQGIRLIEIKYDEDPVKILKRLF